MKRLFLLITAIVLSLTSEAEEYDIDNLSLEDLINVKSTVASKTVKTTRESPGIITVFTKDEIKKMGARDLIDVLLMIPGFNFAYDVQGVVGLSVRGNWAHEGKFALIIDGQEMNELLYSSTQFGNHYPVDHIKKIEVIRGPGSAIYGGFAELAVIQITTENGADINGSRTTLTYGQMREDFGRRNVSLQVGKKIGDWDVSVAGFMGEGRRGDGSFTSYDINTPAANQFQVFDYSEGNANNLNPNWFNIGVTDGKLDFRFIYDHFKTTTREIYGYTGLNEGLRSDFESVYTSLKYDFKWRDVTFSPYAIYKNQNPWRLLDQNAITAGSEIFDGNVNRLRLGASALVQLNSKTNFLAGAEYYKDKARARNWTADLVTPETFAMTGTQSIDFDGAAAYSQLEIDFDYFQMTLGARYEQLEAPQNRRVSKTVPRLAITKAADSWHLKGLASQAYRVPSVFNFDLDYEANGTSQILPETTTTYEAEAGYALSKKSYLTVNVFSIRIEDPIIYDINGGTDSYRNFPQVETQGLEMDYRYKSHWGFTNMTYSYYQRGNNEVPAYQVNDSKELLGIPQHKLTLLSSVKTGLGNLFINPSVVFMSSKHSYAYDIANDREVLEKLPAVTLANLYFSYPHLFCEGLELGVGVLNLFDEENRFVQPYNGGVGHVPAPSREFVARLTYALGF